MAKTPAIISDGSKPLKNNTHERYAKLRAQALPRIVAFRKAGCVARNDHIADTNSFRLEKKRGVRERIEYLALWSLQPHTFPKTPRYRPRGSPKAVPRALHASQRHVP